MLFNRAIADTNPPFWLDIRLHPPVLLFVVAAALVASLFSGAIPALSVVPRRHQRDPQGRIARRVELPHRAPEPRRWSCSRSRCRAGCSSRRA